MKIVIDGFGGDNSPEEIVKGCILSLEKDKDINLVITGNEVKLKNLLTEYGYDGDKIEIVDAKEIITNEESPTEAIRTKKNSSLVVAFDYLNKNEDAKGFVSAGSTGAVLTGSVLMLRRIRGINRPALCPLLPTKTGKNVLLIDCGANSDPKPLNLQQFGIMGTAFMKAVEGVANPRVGLLSNGTEDKKGNALTKEAFPLLKEANINFLGNIEAREILSGDLDVVVSDGFSGNIALKGCEGTALTMFSLIKDGIMKGGLRAKLGYMLLKPVFKGIKNSMDYNNKGGAVLLGLEKLVVKSHGSSKATSICSSILQVKQLIDSNVVDKIKGEFISVK
ncbi:MAG: phosphate acyltransferase PlsX [Clostridia bacterium]